MAETVAPGGDGQALGTTHPLWTFLAVLSGVSDELERARLTATGLPSLVPCSMSGVALIRDSGTGWDLVLQKDGEQLGSDVTEAVLADLPTLFDEAIKGSGVSVATTSDEKGHCRIPPSFEELETQCLAVAPLITMRTQLGMLIVGRKSPEIFSQQDILVLSALRQQSAIAIENARLYRTLRKHSESLEQQNELILTSAGEGIYGLDDEGRATFVNPAAAKMFGWTAEDLMGKPAHAIHHHSRPDGAEYPRSECPIYAAFKDGKVHRVDDEVFWRKDGSCFPVEYTSTPIREGDRLAGAVVVFRDITARKRAEKDLRRALAEVEELKNRLQEENVYLREEIKTEHNFDEILGESPAMRNVLQAIEAVAPTEANVLITGETGTGKELVARAVHALSPRKDKPLIKVNCASIPRELFESEFFGHVKGAFTGAVKDRAGRFQLADKGTLLLDEVGEIPLEMQSKLLRVLQEGEFERIGEEKTRKVDVRIIAATNRKLRQEAEAGRFRQDLYYRLGVFPIEVAPLRHRSENIAPLAEHCLRQAVQKLNCPASRLTRSNVLQLQGYSWPGNVRELQNVIDRAVLTSRGGALHFDSLSHQTTEQPSHEATTRPTIGDHADVIPETQIRQLERDNLLAALQKTNWRIYGQGGAAELLGVKATTLSSRIKTMGLKNPSRE